MENPRGVDQKNQIIQLRAFDLKNPSVNNYCFKTETSDDSMIPAEWWFVSFGDAYKYFVNPAKKFNLESKAEKCDVKFLFEKNGNLSEIN